MLDLIFQIVLGLFIGAAVTIVTAAIIDEVVIRKGIKEETNNNPDLSNAVSAVISEIKRDAKTVHVGLYDKQDNEIGRIEIKSEKGVSKSLYKGKKIYLTTKTR